MILLATNLSLLDPHALIRVDDPDYPGAIVRSETGSVLAEPPPPGTPWRYESMPEPDHQSGIWRADEAIRAGNIEHWHERGFTGQGVKVAVFDILWLGSEIDPNELGGAISHDCIEHSSCETGIDTYRAGFANEEGVHGYACAEIVHDIAPDAELHTVRVSGFTAWENGMKWAIRNDIDVISMSLSFFNNSNYDGTGPFHDLLAEAAANDTLLVTSAGNYAQSHWSGPYTDGDNDGRMDMDGENGLWVYMTPGAGKSIYVNWNQYGTCGSTDLDVYLVDADRNRVGAAEKVQDPEADNCGPTERISATIREEGWYRLEVWHRSGGTSWIDVDVHVRSGQLDAPIVQGSIVDPGSHALAYTVGAVNATGYLDNGPESFSSRGPTRSGVQKPDISGPDGLSTASYGARGFFGTSAATPAVAGMIALIQSRNPELGSYEAAERLQHYALSDASTPGGYDPDLGAGKARLPLLDGGRNPCGRRPLLMPFVFLPLTLFRRRRRESD